MAAGRLPHLAALLRRGAKGPVAPWPAGLQTMVWPTFFTGQRPGVHGWYYGKMWRPDRMRLDYADPGWLPQRPFWDLLPKELELCLVDIPFAPAPRASFNGLFLNGWQTHDDTDHDEWPKGLRAGLSARYGRRILGREDFGPQDAARLRKTRDGSLAATRQIGSIVADLVRERRFDLCVLVLGAAHRAGHYLWDLSQLGPDRGTHPELESAVDEVYVESDRALGRIIEALPPDAIVLAFALHGMGPETGWWEQFPRILAAIEGAGAPSPGGSGLLYRAKSAISQRIVRNVTHLMPNALNQAIVPLWSRHMHDWSRVRAFALPGDIGGFVRINLAGREAEGVVQPGAEYDDLCTAISEGLLSFRTDDDRPVVQGVDRIDGLDGAEGPRRHLLPDLIVHWAPIRAFDLSGVRSPRHGEVRWEKGRPPPSGRSGNHLESGWFIAAGPGIEPGSDAGTRETVDLTATLFSWLGLDVPAALQGRPIAALVSGARPAP